VIIICIIVKRIIIRIIGEVEMVTIGVRIPEEILMDSEESAKEENIDKSTVIRWFIDSSPDF